jgi:hypothetical protein
VHAVAGRRFRTDERRRHSRRRTIYVCTQGRPDRVLLGRQLGGRAWRRDGHVPLRTGCGRRSESGYRPAKGVAPLALVTRQRVRSRPFCTQLAGQRFDVALQPGFLVRYVTTGEVDSPVSRSPCSFSGPPARIASLLSRIATDGDTMDFENRFVNPSDAPRPPTSSTEYENASDLASSGIRRL